MIVEHFWRKKIKQTLLIFSSLLFLLINQSCAHNAIGDKPTPPTQEHSTDRAVSKLHRDMINSLGSLGARPTGVIFLPRKNSLGVLEFSPKVFDIMKKYDVQNEQKQVVIETLSEYLYRLLRTTEISDYEFRILYKYAKDYSPTNELHHQGMRGIN